MSRYNRWRSWKQGFVILDVPFVDAEHEISVHSNALLDTITTLHKAKEYRDRNAITLIRNALEAVRCCSIQWILGKFNVAYVLKYRGTNLSQSLSRMRSDGYRNIDLLRASITNFPTEFSYLL